MTGCVFNGSPEDATNILNGNSSSSNFGSAIGTASEMSSDIVNFAVFSRLTASDFTLHDMGVGLADGISQGAARGNQFRTAPLWGLGQRLFFLHDGRTSDLIQAIHAHNSSGSEAIQVIKKYSALTASQQQDLLNSCARCNPETVVPAGSREQRLASRDSGKRRLVVGRWPKNSKSRPSFELPVRGTSRPIFTYLSPASELNSRIRCQA